MRMYVNVYICVYGHYGRIVKHFSYQTQEPCVDPTALLPGQLSRDIFLLSRFNILFPSEIMLTSKLIEMRLKVRNSTRSPDVGWRLKQQKRCNNNKNQHENT